MPDDFRISELPSSASFNNGDLIEVSQVDAQSESGFTSVKKQMTDVGEMINNGIEYISGLNTTNKKIIGAINEVNSAIPLNSDFTLSGLSDTQITSPANNQVLAYNSGGKVVNVGLNSLMPTTITVVRGSTMSNTFPLPNVSRRGNVCIINFAISLPAGTYNNSTTLWEISPKPIANTRAIVNVGGVQLLNVLTDGTIKFNSNVTLSSATYILGQAVYLTDG